MNSLEPAVSRRVLGADVYARAQRFLYWNVDKYCRTLDIDFRWIGTTDSFWYLKHVHSGKQFIVVDAANGTTGAAFDHDLVARLLSQASGEPVDPDRLPFEEFAFLDGRAAIRFVVAQTAWTCSLDGSGRCSPQRCESSPLPGLLSPDATSLLIRKQGNLWLRSVSNGAEQQLTDDGEQRWAYGQVPGCSAGFRSFLRDSPDAQVPVALWSPDSKKLVTYRLDERSVLDLHLLEMAPHHCVRPALHRYRYAMPGDEQIPTAELLIIDVDSGSRVPVCHAPLPVTMLDPIQDDRVWWDPEGTGVYFIPREVGQQQAQLFRVDAETGATKLLIEERSDTYVEIAGSVWDRAVKILSDGSVLWYSERNDWGHIYLYDRDGQLLRPLTSGAWKVIDVVHVDEESQRVFFTAVGREAGEDPYLRHLYSIRLDASQLRLLTPENAEHEIRLCSSPIAQLLIPGKLGPDKASFSPSGRYFIDTYSRPDLPPTTILRGADGDLIGVIERSDISALERDGLKLPEPFEVLAGDNETKLYGTIYRPSDFDASKQYPVIDVIYPGPQMLGTPKSFKTALYGLYEAMCTQALAELGFVVVTLDGRGTPMRSKSFHDVSYGEMEQAGHLEDHITGLRQLATRYPYMDLDRVGITGHSGGGFAAARAILCHPDFFKVAVSLSGNHDQRGYLMVWGPTYQGRYQAASYARARNAELATNLRGKLLLMHGELDDNVHPALTMQLVDALIRADKDFECLLLPGEDHMLGGGTLPYVHRKTWDYFVRHLLGAEPPNAGAVRALHRQENTNVSPLPPARTRKMSIG